MKVTIRHLLLSGLFTLLAIILFSAIFHRVTQLDFSPSTVMTPWSQIRSTLKTGDLVFFMSNDLTSRIIRFWSGENISHCSMVVRKGDQILFWEADTSVGFDYVRRKEYEDGGPHLSDEKYKLKDYAGCYGMIVRTKKRFPTYDTLIKYFKKYENYKFEPIMLRWYSAQVKRTLFFKRNNRIFCTELIAKTLQDTNIISQNYPPHFYTFADLYNLDEYEEKKEIFFI